MVCAIGVGLCSAEVISIEPKLCGEAAEEAGEEEGGLLCEETQLLGDEQSLRKGKFSTMMSTEKTKISSRVDDE